MPSRLVKINSLIEGDIVRMRGGKKEYSVIAYIGVSPTQRGVLILKDENNKEFQREYFPFTLIHKTITNNSK
jgi:hypothetical protein